MDGFYSLIAGHVEDGESAVNGMIREAEEEAGLILSPSALRVVHIMHRKSLPDRVIIDIFFECDSWSGTLENKEPHKCGDLSLFPSTELPPNTVPYITEALDAINRGQFYSEHGWD
jgi:8-oxo-dGTP pyrophosphatase MutT (NUDIX family)